jgi:DNA-binding PadR family transcriptional regulator
MARQTHEDLSSLGRLSEPALHIMIALADGPKHGYAMATDIEGMTGSRPGPGTLYGAISRLESRQWIEPLGEEGRRRPYRLTSDGARALRARIAALEAVHRIARTRLAGAPESA